MTTGALCNEASLQELPDGSARHFGDTVDVAFLVAARKLGLRTEELVRRYPQVAVIPYESGNRFAASFNMRGDKVVAHVKGAAETLLPMCAGIDRDAVLRQADELAADGFRILALANGETAIPGTAGASVASVAERSALADLGFLGLIDPLRPEASDAVRRCRDAGITVAMVTGDHPATALAIARQLGMAERADEVVTGTDLEVAGADPEALVSLVAGARVFARVEPLQKLVIVEAVKRLGHVVAVTGDGAADAPALSAADIGVAMGLGGTDVARDAADLIITDDNFASIVDGVEQGRIAYDNVRKVIYLLISTNAAEIVLFILAIAAAVPLPLNALQLLWLNLVTEGVQHVALAFEKGEPGVLERRPRPPRQGIFDRWMIEQTLISGLYGGGASYLLFLWALQAGWAVEQASNVVLLFLVLFENGHTFNCRSESRSTFTLSLRDNRFLIVAVAGALGLQLAAMYTPLGVLINAGPVSAGTWGAVLPLAAGVVVIMEIYKRMSRRRP